MKGLFVVMLTSAPGGIQRTIAIFFILLIHHVALSQTPQFAVVQPNGTTFICPSWDSAYNKATDGDHIYLPGGSFHFIYPINKRLHLIGAGSDEDSTAITGPTIFNTYSVTLNASNGSIEGVKINGALYFDGSATVTNYSIKRCFISGGIAFNNNTNSENMSVTNCFIGASSIGGSASFSFLGSGYCNNSMFYNNVISSYTVAGGTGNLFSNNLFLFGQNFASLNLFSGSTYQNNIFQNGMPIGVNNSIFYNNLNGGVSGTSNTVYNWISEEPNLTFISPGSINNGWFPYDKHNNYRIKANSLGKNSGTDGSDRGLYGGAFPWIDGSVPSNPHIYFKQVAPQTNANGQLQIQFKVRTNN